jgi:hypothetical protein
VSTEHVIIKASCPICGDLDLGPDDVTLTVWAGPLRQDRNNYCFHCPKHDEAVTKHASLDTIRRLVSGGVHVTRITVPAEADDPARNTFRPLHTEDDILDACLAMRADNWVPNLKELA